MHASARLRNVTRTLMVHLATANLAGAALVSADDATFDPGGVRAFVRVGARSVTADNAHRLGGDPAEIGRLEIVAECYARTGEGSPAAIIDQVDAIAESVAAALRARTLPLVDYVADPTGATAVTGHAIRFTDPPAFVAAPSLDGWQRRTLTTTGWWILRHTTS